MFAQLLRFGGVGLLATLSHVLVALAVERLAPVSAQGANLAGFAAGVAVSYAGHARVTFGAPLRSGPQFLRFVVLALVGLAVSSATVELVGRVLGLGFGMAMAVVAVVVPAASFLAMRLWVFRAPGAQTTGASGDLALCAAMAAGLVALFWGRAVHHDVAWYLFATQDWLDGARLYVDLVEVNPPLNFYLTVPSLVIADVTGISTANAHYVALALLLLVSLGWSAAILRAEFALSPARRALMLGGAGLAVLVPSLNGLGQREQVMVLCFLPWALREAARRRPMPGEVVPSAALAAVGMCLKPHFVLLPLAVTLLNCLETRSLRPILATANWVFGVVGLAYVGFVWAVHPAYLTDILPLARDVYGAYSRPLTEVVWTIAFPLVLVGFWGLTLLRFGRPSRAVAVLLALSAGGLASYLLQQTGFPYHRVPFLTFSALAAAMLLVEARAAQLPTFAAVAVLGAIAWGGPAQNGFYRDDTAQEVAKAIADFDPVERVMVISSYVSAGPPVAMRLGADWVSSYPANWLVPGAMNRLATTDCALASATCFRLRAAAARNRTANIADIARARPDLVIVDRLSGYIDPRGFDWLAFMAEDPAWGPVFADYAKVAESRRFLYFLRNEKAPP
jgi:putative flippase GtrA